MYADEKNVYINYRYDLLKIPQEICSYAEIIDLEICFKDFSPINKERKTLNELYNITEKNHDCTAKNFGRLLFQSNGEVWALDILPYSFGAVRDSFIKA
jgi:arginine decarboxylase-like protein